MPIHEEIEQVAAEKTKPGDLTADQCMTDHPHGWSGTAPNPSLARRAEERKARASGPREL